MINFRNIALAALAVTALTSVAQAAPAIYFGEDINPFGSNDAPALALHPNSDAARTAFLSGLTNASTETFDSLAEGTPAPLALNFPTAGITATLTAPTGFVSDGTEAGETGQGRHPVSTPNYFAANSDNFVVTFSAPTAAFGFYAVDVGDYGTKLSLVLTDINDVTTTLDINNSTSANGEISGSVLYYGFIDSGNQYKSVAFKNTLAGTDVDRFGFDSFTVGSTEQIRLPEPASLALFGLGLTGLGLVRRRK